VERTRRGVWCQAAALRAPAGPRSLRAGTLLPAPHAPTRPHAWHFARFSWRPRSSAPRPGSGRRRIHPPRRRCWATSSASASPRTRACSSTPARWTPPRRGWSTAPTDRRTRGASSSRWSSPRRRTWRGWTPSSPPTPELTRPETTAGARAADRGVQPGGGVLQLRRARQRELVQRGGAVHGVRPGARRPRGARRPPVAGGHHRSRRQPGRARPLRAVVPLGARRGAQPQRRLARAPRAVAGRALQPLPLRPEPRLVVGDAGGDAGAAGHLVPLQPAGARRLPRDVLQLVVLLLPGGGAHQPHLPAAHPGVGQALRAGERAHLRRAGLGLLHGRGVRPLLPRLRRLVAVAHRRGGDDVRAGGHGAAGRR
jgi:hypothetical protein